MPKLTLILPNGELPVTGKQVTFISPCDSDDLSGLVIGNFTFNLVDESGKPLSTKAFEKDAMVCVFLNIESCLAYVQNSKKVNKTGDILEGDLDMDGHRLLNLPTPVSDSEPATKKFVEDLAGGGVGRETEQGGEIFNDYENNVANGDYDYAAGYDSQSSSLALKLTVSNISGDIISFAYDGNTTDLTRQRIYNYIVSSENAGMPVKMIAHLPDTGEADHACFIVVESNTAKDRIAVRQTDDETFYNKFTPVVGMVLYAWFPKRPEFNDFQDDYAMPAHAAIAHGYQTKASGKGAVAIGTGTTASGHSAFASGAHTYAGVGAHAEGVYSQATGQNSHAEGRESIASGAVSHAEGRTTTASGAMSHAEGENTTASGRYAHAEGNTTIASGQQSHAEGYSTNASGGNSHAEGRMTTASGSGSHAEGNNTIAAGNYQHAEGKYNVEDTENKYAHIIGGGTSNERKNIHTVDWNGNLCVTGDITDGKGNTLADKPTMTYGTKDLTGGSSNLPTGHMYLVYE